MDMPSVSSFKPRTLVLAVVLGICTFSGAALAAATMHGKASGTGAVIQGCTLTCGWSESQGKHCEITCTLPW